MNIYDYDLFKKKDVKSSLQETSKDSSDGTVEYMTLCRKRVVNFDLVKRRYLNERYMSEEKAHSIDALCQIRDDSDDGIYFIEFKNGKVKSKDIGYKVRDSLLIFQDITNTQLDYSRNNIRFILVYNKDCNIRNPREQRAMSLARKGKQDYTEFGLSNLREFCFKDVKAYCKEEFEELFVKRLSI